MGADSRSGADIAFDAGPDCLLGAMWCMYDWALAPLGESAQAPAAAFSGMVDAKCAFGFSPPMD